MFLFTTDPKAWFSNGRLQCTRTCQYMTFDKLFNVVLGGDTTNDDEKMHAFDYNGDTAIGHI